MNSNTSNKPFQMLVYSPQKIGLDLREVGKDYLDIQAEEIRTHWFRGGKSETDIIVWLNNKNNIIKQQVTHIGSVVEWNILDGIRTGMTLDTELDYGNDVTENIEPSTPVSEAIVYDKILNKQSILFAVRLIQNASCVSSDMREKMLQNFSFHKAAQSKDSFLLKIFSFFKRHR